jgi:D-xylose transport system permease protein
MSAVSTTTAGAAPGLARRFRANLQTYALIGALIVIWGFFYAVRPDVFLSPQNISNLFRQMTTTALMSVGMVLVIVTGRIDLSVGKLAGFVSVVVAFFQYYRWPEWIPNVYEFLQTTFGITVQISPEVLGAVLSVVLGLAVGLLYGVIQGLVIAYLNVPAFIVTLGSLWLLNGLILVQTAGKTIAANQPTFSVIGQGYLPPEVGWILAAVTIVALFYMMLNGRRKKRQYGFELGPIALDVAKTLLFAGLVVLYVYVVNQYNGIQVPVLILAVAALVVSYAASNTRFGRYVYAIGGNAEAARLSGIDIRKTVFLVFVLMGFLCGVSGVVLASYIGYGTIGAGTGYELDAIAACILGGTSPLGGEGTIFGAMVGALIMATLTNGLQIMDVPSAWQFVVKAIVLILAVYADVQLKKNR